MDQRPTIWDHFLLPATGQPERRNGQRGKLAWRVCRQFQDPLELEQEFGFVPCWNWRVIDQAGVAREQAIRLMLESDRQASLKPQRCESVMLLPGVVPDPSRIPDQRADTGGGQASSRRATACVSSQTGCGVGCPFCATGRLGYQDNLSCQQIVEQVYWAGLEARRHQRRIRNVVFMGMGEPLHNADAVLESIHWLTDQQTFGLSPRRITVSTVGVPRQMLRLVRRFPRIRLALSLHAAETGLRRQLVPRALGDLDLLRQTIREINHVQRGSPVWLEITLLAGVNDRPQDARAVIEFCQDLSAEVNLIPYNEAAGADRFLPSSKATREHYAALLRSAGIRTTLRTSFGAEQSAACGQLASSW